MRNIEAWRPTKFDRDTQGNWVPSRDAEKLSVSSRLYAGQAVALYQEALRDYARGDLADLGCGLVPLYGAYKDRTASVTCVDWAESIHDSPHLDYALDLSGPLDALQDNSFDTILMTDVLEHLPDPNFALGEVTRILRPGGALILGVPFMYLIHEAPHDYYRYTEHILRRMLEGHGHTIARLEHFGGPVDVVFDVVGKSLGATRCPPAIIAIEQRLGGIVTRSLPAGFRRRGSRMMPLGHMVVSVLD